MNESALKSAPVSQAVRRRNPHIYGERTNQTHDSGVHPGLQSAKREPNPVQTLDLGTTPRSGRKRKLVAIVTILAFRNRYADDDNITAGCKSLRDCIATSLGVDDGDGRVRFECRAVQTGGREQTIVIIDLV